MSRPQFPDLEDARRRLQPLLDLRLLDWKGLPDLQVSMLGSLLGEPARSEDAMLGWYPARRLTYPVQAPAGGLAAYARADRVVMVETLVPPPLSVLADLGEPCAIKPHEIRLEGAYVYEYVFCNRGLVLSVAQPFGQSAPSTIARCRGMRHLASPDEYGPEFHRPLEDHVAWSSAGAWGGESMVQSEHPHARRRVGSRHLWRRRPR